MSDSKTTSSDESDKTLSSSHSSTSSDSTDHLDTSGERYRGQRLLRLALGREQILKEMLNRISQDAFRSSLEVNSLNEQNKLLQDDLRTFSRRYEELIEDNKLLSSRCETFSSQVGRLKSELKEKRAKN